MTTKKKRPQKFVLAPLFVRLPQGCQYTFMAYAFRKRNVISIQIFGYDKYETARSFKLSELPGTTLRPLRK